MPFARIPLSFDAMDAAYKDNKSLPADIQKWLDNQHKVETDYNENKLPQINEERAKKGLPPLRRQWSTPCCMQASLAFNATKQVIPKAGSRDRDNTTLDGGKHYILAVNEFRAYLTYRYGPTEQVADLSEISGTPGILIFGDVHIELWDGKNILQSAEALKSKGRKTDAVISPGMLSARPQWFWELAGERADEKSDIPEWLVGWWKVYDGNYYYYYFFKDAHVVYIEERPNTKWIPPKSVGNRGKVTKDDEIHGFRVHWQPTKGETIGTEEKFTRLNWTSEEAMNATSNKYAPLYAQKMK